MTSTDGAQTGSTGTAAHYQENRAGDGNFAYSYPTPMDAEVMAEDARGGNTIDNLSRFGVCSSALCFQFVSVPTMFLFNIGIVKYPHFVFAVSWTSICGT